MCRAVAVYGMSHIFVAHRVKYAQRNILQFVLYGAHSQTVCDRGVNIHGLLSFVQLLLRLPPLGGAHIVQTVTEVYNHNSDILAHGQKHFTQIFRLLFFQGGKFNLTQFCDTVNKQCHIFIEHFFNVLNGHIGVLYHIV